MYRVMAVDDEIWVLRGLKRYIAWEDYGFTVASMFTDPQKAYAAFQEEPVDVVFADIRMAGIDGLTLIDMMRTRRRETQFVILSAHSQFDYAKRAISLGVADYMVKPITKEALLGMLQLLKARLDETRTQEERSRLYECLTRPDFVLTPQAFQALTGLRLMPGGMLGAFCWEKAGYAPHPGSTPLCVFDASDGRFSYALCRASPGQWEEVCGYMKAEAQKERIAIGQSEPFSQCGELHRALECAQRGASHRFFTRASGLYCARFDHRTPAEIDAVLQKVRAGGYEAAAHALEGWDDAHCEAAWDIADAFYLYRGIVHLLHTGVGDSEDAAKARLISSPQAMAQAFESFNRLKAALCAMLLGAGGQNGALEIMRVEAYIGAHYTQPISVRQIARVFSVDPEYLGRMYRRKTGKSIHQAIAEKRIAYACKLLRANEVSVQEIAGLSGFSDPFYFNKVFKKAMGMPPTQYRNAEKHQR